MNEWKHQYRKVDWAAGAIEEPTFEEYYLILAGTDGQLSYGYTFEEGYEFPWGDDDIEDWWRQTKGFEPINQAELWSGDSYSPLYKENREEWSSLWRQSDDHRTAWDAENPLPVELITHCSHEYGMYILAVPGANYSNSRGSTEQIEPAKMLYVDHRALDKFIKDYELEPEEGPGWFLTSYWD